MSAGSVSERLAGKAHRSSVDMKDVTVFAGKQLLMDFVGRFKKGIAASMGCPESHIDELLDHLWQHDAVFGHCTWISVLQSKFNSSPAVAEGSAGYRIMRAQSEIYLELQRNDRHVQITEGELHHLGRIIEVACRPIELQPDELAFVQEDVRDNIIMVGLLNAAGTKDPDDQLWDDIEGARHALKELIAQEHDPDVDMLVAA